MKTAYDKALETLSAQYKAMWEIADAEKAETGAVSEETHNLLCTIEMELEMLDNAV